MADFTIQEFLAWARTKPAGERYDYYAASVCAIAQFGAATGRECLIGIGDLHHAESEGVLPECLWWEIMEDDNTFGGLVARLEKLCPPSEWTKLDAYMEDIEATAADFARDVA